MTRGLIDSSSAASFWTQFDIFKASTSAWRSMSSSGMPVGGILTTEAWSRAPPVDGTSPSRRSTGAIASIDLRLGEVPSAGGGRDHAAIVKIPPSGIPLEDIERHALVEALKMSNWVQKDAAELLSISPRVMNYKIKTLNIEFPRGRRAAPLVAAAS